MSKDKISNSLFEILQKVVYYTPLTKEAFEKGTNAPLTGNYWDLDAVQMVYLFC